MSSNAVELIARLAHLGIQIEKRGAELVVTAPKGALTPEIIAAIQKRKPELMECVGRWRGHGEIRGGMSWYAWKAQRLNRVFAEQGALGRPGRFTAESMRAAETHAARYAGRQRTLQPEHSPLIKEPDKTDKLSLTSATAAGYGCQIPLKNPTSTRQTQSETRHFDAVNQEEFALVGTGSEGNHDPQ
jgi:hypothetical protein